MDGRTVMKYLLAKGVHPHNVSMHLISVLFVFSVVRT